MQHPQGHGAGGSRQPVGDETEDQNAGDSRPAGDAKPGQRADKRGLGGTEAAGSRAGCPDASASQIGGAHVDGGGTDTERAQRAPQGQGISGGYARAAQQQQRSLARAAEGSQEASRHLAEGGGQPSMAEW